MLHLLELLDGFNDVGLVEPGSGCKILTDAANLKTEEGFAEARPPLLWMMEKKGQVRVKRRASWTAMLCPAALGAACSPQMPLRC